MYIYPYTNLFLTGEQTFPFHEEARKALARTTPSQKKAGVRPVTYHPHISLLFPQS